MRAGPLFLAASLLVTAPALAGEARIDVQGGRAGAVAIALARQTGASIVIADPAIAGRAVPAIKGRMSAQDAVRRLARAAGARAVQSSANAWRLVADAPPAPVVAVRRPLPSHRPAPVMENLAPVEPIVVIGSKRNLTLAEYPGQISVLDGADLERGGVGGSEKITQRLATVTSTYLGSGRNKLFIRGIADSSFTGPTQATVGQYLGDLRLSYNAPDPDLRLSDLERVEVLEGPQGALYGAGSLGGIVRVVPHMPDLYTVSGAAQMGGSITWHGDPGADASATVNVPLAEGLAALRLTGDAVRYGGFIDKPAIARRDVNRTGIVGGRAILRVTPLPDLTIDLIGLGQSTRASDSQYATREGDPLTSRAQVREGARADYAQGQLVIGARLGGGVELRSSTGLTRHDLGERYDATVADGEPRLFEQTNSTRMFAHETRIWHSAKSGFGWLVGGSYTRNRTLIGRRFITQGVESTVTGVSNTIHEATLYGEASVPVRPGLIATLGGRYTYSRLGGEGQGVSPLIAIARAEVTASRSEARFLPSAALLGKLGPDSQIYLRYQQGFRPGGLAVENDFVRRFRNDSTATYEVGMRHGRPDRGPFDLTVSLSYTRWHDIQADFIDGSGLPSSANIGDGRVWSGSVTGGVWITRNLRVDGGMTVNRSRVDHPDVAALLPMLAAFTRADQLAALYTRTSQVPNIAHVSGRLGFAWRHSLANDLSLDWRGWTSYIGRSRLGVGPELGEPQGNYLDSGMSLRIGRDGMGVTLGVTNLVDAKGNRFSLGTPFSLGRQQLTPLPPRTVRLGLDARF